MRKSGMRVGVMAAAMASLLMVPGVSWGQQECAKLTDLKLPQVKIASAELIAAAVDKTPTMLGMPQELKLPAYCKVKGDASPTADSDIKFELWMPAAESWKWGPGGLYQYGVYDAAAEPRLRDCGDR
jgi:hypothetical protein